VVTTMNDGCGEGSCVEPATTADEIPVYLPAGREHVFGILTRPTGPANGTALLCFHAGAQNLTSHRNRVYTRLCREVAGAGYTAFRMDFHGTGDSSGVLVDRDVSGQTLVDVDVAVRWLTEQGAQRIVVVGTCWGALVALVAAARHEGVVSTCLISPPLYLLETGASVTQGGPRHERLSRALSHALRPHVFRLLLVEQEYRKWVISRVRRRVLLGLAARFGGFHSTRHGDDHVKPSAQSLFTPLLQRRVPIRVLFGEQDQTHLDLLKLGTVPSLEAASEIIDMVVTPVTVHGLATVRAQDAVAQYVKDCVARDAGIAAPTASGGAGAGLLVDD
jgi:pimeloyl-ACP methyl ester carboxylesterase